MTEFTLPEALRNLPGINSTPTKVKKIETISVGELHHYAAHPFSLYKDERKKEMVESIRQNGILNPLIVRPKDYEYEILAGHNRFECGKEAGLTEFPCIVEDVNDEEAQLIVTITNLNQRSLNDMLPSERATAIKAYYEAIKAQGKRSDLIDDIKDMLENADKADEIKENLTSSLIGKKLDNRAKTGDEFNLSSRAIGRYIRIAELSKDFQELLDDNALGIYAGVELSYLTLDEQDIVYRYITDNGLKIDTKKAEVIRRLSKQKKLDIYSLPAVWQAKSKSKPKSKNKITLKRNTFADFFTEDDSDEEIEETIKAALEFYFENVNTSFEETEDESDETAGKEY